MSRRLFAPLAVLLFAISLIIGLIVSHEGNHFSSAKSYFNNAVTVEYHQFRYGRTQDYLLFRFAKSGNYRVSFSTTPGLRGRGQNRIPKKFAVDIKTPRDIKIQQYILPDFLRATIVMDGQSESHDFR